DDINYKPNYYGLMNYTWAIPRAWDTAGGWKLDYSRYALPTLLEYSLSEPVGIQGDPSVLVPVGPPPSVLRPMGGPIDWDRRPGVDGVGLEVDINRVRSRQSASPGDTLAGYDDWNHIKIGFADSPESADAVHDRCTGDDELPM